MNSSITISFEIIENEVINIVCKVEQDVGSLNPLLALVDEVGGGESKPLL